MGEQIRDKITAADCIAYAEACEQWATQAPNEAAGQRLLDMARSWRDLERHMTGSKAAAKTSRRARSGKGGKASSPQAAGGARPGAAARRHH